MESTRVLTRVLDTSQPLVTIEDNTANSSSHPNSSRLESNSFEIVDVYISLVLFILHSYTPVLIESN
jgi:hypothetical protein